MFPFFLEAGAAICRGRGERIEPIRELPPLDIVIACPPAGLSTADVYRHCLVGEPRLTAQPLLAALAAGNPREIGAAMHNRLEEAAAQLSPWIDRLRREFSAAGCPAAQMSGSGTSYFGICRQSLHARQIAARLRSRGYLNTFAVRAGSQRKRTAPARIE